MADGGEYQGGTSTFVLIPKNNKMYVFTFSGGWNPITKYKDFTFIKDILSTFKFLE